MTSSFEQIPINAFNTSSLILVDLIEQVKSETNTILSQEQIQTFVDVLQSGTIEQLIKLVQIHISRVWKEQFFNSSLYTSSFFVISKLFQAGKIAQKDIEKIVQTLWLSFPLPRPTAKHTHGDFLLSNILEDRELTWFAPEHERIFNTADVLMTLGKIQEAFTLFRRSIAHPQTEALHYGIFAFYLITHGCYEEALKVLQRGETLFPENRDIQKHLGVCYHKMKQFKESDVRFGRSMAEESMDQQTYLTYLYFLNERWEYIKTQQLATDFLKKHPNDIGILWVLAFALNKLLPVALKGRGHRGDLYYLHICLFHAYYYLRDEKNAEHHVWECLKVAPPEKVSIVEYEYRALLQEVGKVKVGIRRYTESLNTSPEDPKLHTTLAFMMRQLEKPDEKKIIQHLEKAIEFSKKQGDSQSITASYYSNLSVYFQEIGKIATATREARSAHKLDPTNVSYILQLANYLSYLGWNNLKESDALFSKAIEIEPENITCKIHYGKFLMVVGNHTKAIWVFQELFDKPHEHKNVAQAHNLLWMALITSWEYVRSLELLSQAIEMQPENAEFICDYAEWLHQAHRKDKTQKDVLTTSKIHFEKAIALSSKDADIRYKFSRLLIDDEKYMEAIIQLEEAHKIAPQWIECMIRLSELYKTMLILPPSWIDVREITKKSKILDIKIAKIQRERQ
jgi:tetratricopeptide (TPR) repeat protein